MENDVLEKNGEVKTVIEVPSNRWYFCVLIIINAAIGAGILALSEAYHKAGGLYISITLQIIFGILSAMTMITMAYCADKTKANTYQEVVSGCCGKIAYILCSFLVSLYGFGVCITFLIIIGDQSDKVFQLALGDQANEFWYTDRRFIITITSLVIIYPMCIPGKIDFLRYPSLIGVLGIVYVGILVIVEYFTELPPPGEIKTSPDHWTDVFFALPAICFGFQSHLSATPVYASMRGRPNQRTFALVSFLSVLVSFVAYLLVAMFGYLSFGSKVSPDIMVSYPPKAEVMIGVALIAVKTFTSYPLLHLVGRSGAESVILSVTKLPADKWIRYKKVWNAVFATIWFIITLILALFIPDIGSAIGVLGSMAALFIFAFPGACLASIIYRERRVSSRKRILSLTLLAAFYLIIGLVTFFTSFVKSILRLVNEGVIKH